MKAGYLRFFLPVIFAVAGISGAFYFVMDLSRPISLAAPLYDLIDPYPGRLPADAAAVITWVIPISILVFIVLAFPVAFIFLFFNKVAKATTYEQNIMNTGQEFGALYLIRRTVAPALFSITISQVIIGSLPNWLFNDLPAAAITGLNGQTYAMMQSILGGLFALPIALAYFMPTWIINDAGIVNHLQTDELKSRRLPHTIGVGRWFSNFLADFSLLSFPISMFWFHFYRPYIVWGAPLEPVRLTISLFWTVGLPLILMAFIVPIVIFNELVLKWTVPRVQGFAKKLGAKDVQLEHLQEI